MNDLERHEVTFTDGSQVSYLGDLEGVKILVEQIAHRQGTHVVTIDGRGVTKTSPNGRYTVILDDAGDEIHWNGMILVDSRTLGHRWVPVRMTTDED